MAGDDKGKRVTRWFAQHWPHAIVAVAALLALSFLALGLISKWGAQQWGSYADWVVGGLTLAAVTVALWQAFRGEHARLVDHDMARRRECIGALSDLWGAITQMSLKFPMLTDFYKNLPERFNPNLPRRDNVTPKRPGMLLAEEMSEGFFEFTQTWLELLEPPLFVALSLSRGTPLDDPMKELNKSIRRILDTDLREIAMVAMGGQRPDVSGIEASWGDVLQQRQTHLNLAREHFGLGLEEVEASVSQRRRRRPGNRPPAAS